MTSSPPLAKIPSGSVVCQVLADSLGEGSGHFSSVLRVGEELGIAQSILCHLEREDLPINPKWLPVLKKLGFPVPLNDWLREDKYYNMVKEKFTGPVAEKFFNVDEIMRLLDDHKAGKAKNMTKIWSFYSFILWYELYFVNTQAPAGIY